MKGNCTGDVGQIIVHGRSVGPMADAVPNSFTCRSAIATSRIVEGTLSTLLGPMVLALGFRSAPDSATD